MICPACDRDNDARRRYCGDCGADLRQPCARCGFENEHRDRFCGGCRDHLGATGTDTAQIRSPRPAPSSDHDDVVDVVETEELEQLLEDCDEAAAEVDLPSGRVTQQDLDELFGGVA